MMSESKVTEFFCAIDDFNKNFDKEKSNHTLISSPRKRRRNRKNVMSESAGWGGYLQFLTNNPSFAPSTYVCFLLSYVRHRKN